MVEEIHVSAVGLRNTDVIVRDLGDLPFVYATRNRFDVDYLSFKATKEILNVLMHKLPHILVNHLDSREVPP
jgi:hypothetical protein